MAPKPQKSHPAAANAIGQAMRAAQECEAQGQLPEALSHYRRALDAAPNDPGILARFCTLLARTGRNQEGVERLGEACRKNPRDGRLRHLLGTAYLSVNDVQNAEIQLRKAAKLAPQAVPVLIALGDCCVAAQKPGDAEPFYQKALTLTQNNQEVQIRLAGLHALLGRKEEARKLYQSLAAAGVNNPLVYSGLIEVSDYSDVQGEPGEYLAAEKMAENPAFPPALRRMLYFSAAKVDRAQGRRDTEFAHYARGKEVYPEQFDLAYFAEVTAALKQAITPEFFEERARYADKSTRPILIFGMPRSGTTLIEQVLAAHPSVAAAGELPFFSDAARALGLSSRRVQQSVPPERIAEAVRSLEPADAKRLAAQYLAKLQFHGGGKMRVTDKMPLNFLHLWLIALLFPKAVFIHSVRDPVATCFSCYTTDLGDAHNYTADFETLAGYYHIYEDLMQHWKAALPVSIFENIYEELVTSPEESARKLVEATRLPWNESCLTFHQSDRTANTASYAEVRKPIHAESAEKWREYADFIEPLRAALEKDGASATDSAAPTSHHASTA